MVTIDQCKTNAKKKEEREKKKKGRRSKEKLRTKKEIFETSVELFTSFFFCLQLSPMNLKTSKVLLHTTTSAFHRICSNTILHEISRKISTNNSRRVYKIRAERCTGL